MQARPRGDSFGAGVCAAGVGFRARWLGPRLLILRIAAIAAEGRLAPSANAASLLHITAPPQDGATDFCGP